MLAAPLPGRRVAIAQAICLLFELDPEPEPGAVVTVLFLSPSGEVTTLTAEHSELGWRCDYLPPKRSDSAGHWQIRVEVDDIAAEEAWFRVLPSMFYRD